MTQLRIAVVGAGLAGLAAAWLLARRHEVVLYEREATPGFTAHSVGVADAGGGRQRIDVPLRVFYPGYYPTLARLYTSLGVSSQPVSYAATLTDGEGRAYFRWRNLRFGERSFGSWAPADALLGAQAWRIAAGAWRFSRAARRTAKHAPAAGESIAEFCVRQRLPQDFVDGLLLPAICTVGTCSTEQAREVPAEVIVEYLQRGLMRQAVRRALQGADEVQRLLLEGIPDLRCHARIRTLRRGSSDVRLLFENGREQAFDHVVLATQANQALALLGSSARVDEAAVLDSIRYVAVEVLTHRDAALLPPRRRDWSPVNLVVDPEHAAPVATIWINAVQPALRDAADVFQTVSPIALPREDLLLGRARFERPLVGGRSSTALQTLERLQREQGRRVWFCGSWAAPGIPLLEGAVSSAAVVAARLGSPL